MIKTLFENTKGLIELRALPSRSRVFVRSGGHTLFCRKHCREDLYFGVATRDGHGGRKENIVSIPAVWVDIDFKDTPINEARGLLRRFPFKPTFTLMSGGGVHLYWKLKEPAGMDDIEAVEGINKRIVAALKGDATGTEAARILRVPGSMNFKYNPPRPVKVVKYNAFEYTLEAFEILPEVHHKRPAMIPEQLQAIPAILPECIRFIIEKAPHDVSRGVRSMRWWCSWWCIFKLQDLRWAEPWRYRRRLLQRADRQRTKHS